MKILFNSQGFGEVVGGISRYFAEVITHFPADFEAIMSTSETKNLYLQQAPFNIARATVSWTDCFGGRRFPAKRRVCWLLSKLFPTKYQFMESRNAALFNQQIAAGDFDVYHFTGADIFESGWKRILGRKPVVMTIHDLIPELGPMLDWRGSRRVEGSCLGKITEFITVSDNTKKDLINFYGVNPEHVTTIYHGVTCVTKREPVVELLAKRFVLYVGKRGGYKNFDFFVNALSPIFSRDASLYLVCTGSDFTNEERRLLSGLSLLDRTVCRRFSDDELHWLFEHALVFVYPSLYEGFGLPILEAFAAGCPVLLARASCFPEVGGDAALYFNPGDKPDLTRMLTEVLADDDKGKSLRESLKVRGLERVKSFTWDRCAQETVAVYKKAIMTFKRQSEMNV